MKKKSLWRRGAFSCSDENSMGVTFCALSVLAALAGPASAESGRPKVAVGLDLDEAAVDPAEAERALQSHMSDTDFEIVVFDRDPGQDPELWIHEVEDDPTVRALIWVEGEGDEARLSLKLPGQTGTWSRELERSDDPDALLETLGVMVRGMVPVIPAVLPQPPPETPLAEPAAETPNPAATPPEPAPKPAPTISLDVGYAGMLLARALPWHHAGMLAVGYEGPAGLSARVGAGWAPPQRARTSPSMRLQRIPVEGVIGYRFRRTAALRPAVGAVVRAEALGWNVEDESPLRGTRGWGARLGLGVEAELRWQAWRGLFLAARVRGVGWPLNAKLDSRVAEQQVTVLSPFAGSLSASLAVGYAFEVRPK